MNNSKGTIHAARLKAIRKYVDFNYNLNEPLTGYAKRKIKKYYDQINELTNKTNQIYRPRNKNNLKIAQRDLHREKTLPGIKVAFVPTNGRDKVKIKIKGGRTHYETEYIKSEPILFDSARYASDPVNYTKNIIADVKADRFQIMAGDKAIPNSYSKRALPEKIKKLADKYSDPDKNNFHGKWLKGVIAHKFDNQASMDDYRKEKEKNQRELSRQRRNAKRRKGGKL